MPATARESFRIREPFKTMLADLAVRHGINRTQAIERAIQCLHADTRRPAAKKSKKIGPVS